MRIVTIEIALCKKQILDLLQPEKKPEKQNCTPPKNTSKLYDIRYCTPAVITLESFVKSATRLAGKSVQ